MEQERNRAIIAQVVSGFYCENRNPIIKKQLEKDFEFRKLLINCVAVREDKPMLGVDHIWYLKFAAFYTPAITIFPELFPALYLLPKSYHKEIMDHFEDGLDAAVFVLEVISNDWTIDGMKEHFNDLEEAKNE